MTDLDRLMAFYDDPWAPLLLRADMEEEAGRELHARAWRWIAENRRWPQRDIDEGSQAGGYAWHGHRHQDVTPDTRPSSMVQLMQKYLWHAPPGGIIRSRRTRHATVRLALEHLVASLVEMAGAGEGPLAEEEPARA